MTDNRPRTGAEPSEAPFIAFNFAVEIAVDGVAPLLCNAGFAECAGLEMRMAVRTIHEGGNNEREIHLAGRVSYSNLILRRGMTPNFDLWDWFTRTASPGGYALRSSRAVVTLLHADGVTPRARFALDRCLPVRLVAPTLNARADLIAIEELELAYEALRLERPG